MKLNYLCNSFFKYFSLTAYILISGCVVQDQRPAQIHLDPDESLFPSNTTFPLKKDKIPTTTTINLEPRIFTLNQAVQTALKADPRIMSAMENINQAEADLITAGLIPNPQLNTDIQLMPLNRPFTVNRQGGPPQFDFNIAMPIDWFLFGKRAAAIEFGKKGVEAATADFANTLRLKIAATISAFYDALEMQALLDLAKENQSNLDEMEQIILKRVALGGVGTIEADRIKLSIFSGNREVHVKELDLAAAINKLRAILGIEDGTPIQVKGTLDVKSLIKPIDTEAAFKLAEENRPDLAALHSQLNQAKADITVQERKAYPQVTPSIGYSRQFQQQAIGFPDANSWMAGINISVPLFDSNQGNIIKARSIKNQTQYNLQAQLVDLRAEIDQAVKTFASAYQFLHTDDPGQLEAAQNVRNKIAQAYELGGKALIEVLDAQRIFLDTFRVHISGRSAYWHSLNQLNAVIGKEVMK